MGEAGPLQLNAGPVRLLFDNGMVRSISCGGTEVIRRIYMALRDRYWNTIPYEVSNVNCTGKNGGFLLVYSVVHVHPQISFSWMGTLEGTGDGSVSLRFEGKAGSTFLRNRIGWCVLHPLGLCKGAACTIEKTDGSTVVAAFPGGVIAPFPPFLDIRAMTYPAGSGINCTIRFAGDTFETEDQRNWTDGSFKTYSTPQEQPVPVRVEKGTEIVQEVHVAFSGKCPGIKSPSHSLRFNAGRGFGSIGRVPQLGLLCRMGGPPKPAVLRRLAALELTHLRCDIDCGGEVSCERIGEIRSVCRAAGCGVELSLFFGSGPLSAVEAVGRALVRCPPDIRRILIFSSDRRVTPATTLKAVKKTFAPLFPGVEFGAGTDYYFVEINRKPPDTSLYDVLCYSASPQVHTFDDRAVMENLEGLSENIAAAGILSCGKPVVLSPCTLRPRKRNESPGKFGGPDPRQKSLFAAAWLVGVLCECCDAGLYSLTCGDVAGPEGLMSRDGNILYPVYHVFNSGIKAGAAVSTATRMTEDGGIALLRAEGPHEDILLVANLAADGNSVGFDRIPEGCGCALLDEQNCGNALSDPLFWEHATINLSEVMVQNGVLELGPYAIARISVPRTINE